MLHGRNWYDDEGWRAEAGYYRLLLPVPDSNWKNWNDQVAHLGTIDEAWQPAPVAVAATAFLVYLTVTGNDPLQNGWCRCAESFFLGRRAGLTVNGGCVNVYCDWNDDRDSRLWLAASRKA
jgi:hypothetical protein